MPPSFQSRYGTFQIRKMTQIRPKELNPPMLDLFNREVMTPLARARNARWQPC